jgi:hypothetical protein
LPSAAPSFIAPAAETCTLEMARRGPSILLNPDTTLQPCDAGPPQLDHYLHRKLGAAPSRQLAGAGDRILTYLAIDARRRPPAEGENRDLSEDRQSQTSEGSSSIATPQTKISPNTAAQGF